MSITTDFELLLAEAALSAYADYSEIGVDSTNVDTVITSPVEHGGAIPYNPIVGSTALVLSIITFGRADELIDIGADVTKQSNGLHPIHWAAMVGNAGAAGRILEENADECRARTETVQSTPIHIAAAAQSIDVIELLLHRGCDPNAVNANGNTALHIAAALNAVGCAELLVDFGADLSAKNGRGEAPADVARARDNDDVVKFLAAAEASPRRRSSLPRNWMTDAMRAARRERARNDRELAVEKNWVRIEALERALAGQ